MVTVVPIQKNDDVRLLPTRISNAPQTGMTVSTTRFRKYRRSGSLRISYRLVGGCVVYDHDFIHEARGDVSDDATYGPCFVEGRYYDQYAWFRRQEFGAARRDFKKIDEVSSDREAMMA